MHTRFILTAAAIAGTAVLGGCNTYDPLYAEGRWNPEHDNRSNLTLMAANPADLVRGSGESTSNGVMAAAAVDRLYTNKLKKLLDAGTSAIQTQSQGGGGGQ